MWFPGGIRTTAGTGEWWFYVVRGHPRIGFARRRGRTAGVRWGWLCPGALIGIHCGGGSVDYQFRGRLWTVGVFALLLRGVNVLGWDVSGGGGGRQVALLLLDLLLLENVVDAER